MKTIKHVCLECNRPFEYEYFRGMKRKFCSKGCRLKFNCKSYRKKHPERVKAKDHRRYVRMKEAMALMHSIYMDAVEIRLRSDPEFYAMWRDRNRKAHARYRRKHGLANGTYSPRPYRRIPDYLAKGSHVLDTTSVFILNNHSQDKRMEMDGYARELAIERRNLDEGWN